MASVASRPPGSSRSEDVRLAPGRLYATVVRVGELIARERNCLLVNQELFTAGLKAIIAEAKDGVAFGLIEPGQPFLSYFKFDELQTPTIVPRTRCRSRRFRLRRRDRDGRRALPSQDLSDPRGRLGAGKTYKSA